MQGTGQTITTPDGRKATVIGYYSNKFAFVEYADGSAGLVRIGR